MLFLVIAGLAVTGGLLALRTNSLAVLDEQRGQSQQVAKETVAEVLSYRHETLDADRQRAAELVTGSFAEDFNALMDEVLGATVLDKQASVTTTVTNTSVMESEQGAVVLLVLLAQESEHAEQKTPVISSTAARVEMREVDGRWLIADLSPL
ncbi:hypothetical protein [Amycolatopsis marina]|uniref:hypothetical protein n=1 Tax=Amycolatopsis marina TaxID=490629 RepID=UPI000B8705EA|nr:hypothetical protein [Amycolatopsis marina]